MDSKIPEFLYRFRPVDRLLGQEASEIKQCKECGHKEGGEKVVGELEGLYIYFASKEQLNDPMEGYKQIFWSGDVVVWSNLFRHYMVSLFFRLVQAVLRDLKESEFPIFVSVSSCDPRAAKIARPAISKFLEDSNIKEHIRLLAYGQRRVCMDELVCHFRYLHLLALKILLQELQENGVRDESFAGILEIEKIYSTEFLDGLKEALLKAQSSPEVFVAELVELRRKLSHQGGIIPYFKAWKDNADPIGWYSVFMSFPEDYVMNLEKLTYPDWYVACFMTDNTNSSIWGTYGQSHKEVCLKFRPEIVDGVAYLPLYMPVGSNGDEVVWGESKLEFREVKYGSNFLEVDFFRSLGRMSMGVLRNDWYTDEVLGVSDCAKVLEGDQDAWRKRYWNGYYESASVKMEDWMNEREYRLLQSTGMDGCRGVSQRKLKYNFESLDGIVFGMKTPPEKKMKIISLIQFMCKSYGRKDFNFYQAVYDPVSNKILEHRIPIAFD